jgi:colicin import membrane protein
MVWLGLLWASQALAQDPATPMPVDNTAAYQRIDVVRAQAMAGFAAEDAQCYQQFAVSGCLKDVQTRRRALLADLRRQEADLHEGEFAQRAAEQRQRASQKALERQQQEADLRADNGADRILEKGLEQQEKQAAHAAKASAPVSGEAAPLVPTGPSAAEQAANRESYARKLQDAEKKRQELARRLAETPAKPAAPLPVPK